MTDNNKIDLSLGAEVTTAELFVGNRTFVNLLNQGKFPLYCAGLKVDKGVQDIKSPTSDGYVASF